MPSSSVIKQTEKLLEDVLQTVQRDYESPYSVLTPMERNRFVEEEQSLQKQLEEVRESQSNCSSWRHLALLQPSPQAATKCLRDAEELRRRVKDDINTKLRMRLTGRSNLPPPSTNGQDPARTPEIYARLPLVEDSLEPASAVVTSPMNMRCSLPDLEASEANVSSGHPPTRRTPPPPPQPRGIALSSHSRPSLNISSNSGGDYPRRSPTVRRPAPSPPQSPRLSNLSFPLPAPFLDSAVISSMSSLAQDMDSPASSVDASGSRQTSHGRRSKGGGSYVSKTNYVDINGSTVEGMTINNGGTKNSGAVIHKMMPPRRVS